MPEGGSTQQQVKQMQDDTEADQDTEPNSHRNDFHKIDFDDKYVKYVSDNDQAEPMFLELNVNGIKTKNGIRYGNVCNSNFRKIFQ